MRTTERQYQFDVAYMKMALAIAELSYAERRKVGCIIVSSDDQVISQGFNGTPHGMENECEDVECVCNWTHGCAKNSQPIHEVMSHSFCKDCSYCKLTTKKEVLHAETNAITKCAKWHSSTSNGTLYVTLSPCIDCAKLIIQADIKRVVYLDEYRDTTGIDFLKKYGIRVVRLEM